MNDYRIFVGAFPEGDLADRLQVVRMRHDAKTARITAPHVTLAGTYWRNGSPTPENEAETIERLRSIENQLQPFVMTIGSVETFLPRNAVIYLHIDPTPELLAVRTALLHVLGLDKQRHFTPHLTLTMRLDQPQTETLWQQLRQTDRHAQRWNVLMDHLWLMQRGPNDPAWRSIYRIEMRR